MRRRLAIAVTVAALGGAPASAREIPLGDAENPRNVRWDGEVVLYVRGSPAPERPQVVGERAGWRAGDEVRWEEVRETISGTASPLDEASWTLDGRAREPKRREGGPLFVPWIADGRRHDLVVSRGKDRCAVATDALRVHALVGKVTKDADDKRFGSVVRRFRKSLDDLNALLATSVHPLAPSGVVDRFRLDGASTFEIDPNGGAQVLVAADADVVVLLDEAIWAPRAGPVSQTVLWSYAGRPDHAGRWSSWGEQSLWRDLLRSRGVQDFAPYVIADGGLPGRWKGPLPLPRRYARDLVASPEQAPWISEYTAVVANAHAGAAVIGDVEEDPTSRFGHVWGWLPGRLDVVLSRGGVPAAEARLRWWRGLPRETGAGQGVAEGRAPDGEATCDATGKATVTGDYLGREKPRVQRSRWLLVEAEVAGERRFEVVYGLDLNLAYARGEKYGATVRLEWDSLLGPGRTLSPDR
jgi:hypothetical protein